MILITGASGFIGQSLLSYFNDKYSILATDVTGMEPIGKEIFFKGDIQNVDFQKELFCKYPIKNTIHLAAEKRLTVCEEDRKKANKINVEATLNLFENAKRHQSHFIFLSSDQVFRGDRGCYNEDSKIDPINQYGLCKAEVEQSLHNQLDTATCRTALVFGEIPREQRKLFLQCRNNDEVLVQSYFVQQVAYRLSTHQMIHLPSDEYITPTHTSLLARQLGIIVEKKLTGIFHCCGSERVSRYEMGVKIARYGHWDPKLINAEPSSSVLRPKDVSMNVERTQKQLGFLFNGLDDMISMTMFKEGIK